MGLWKVTNGWIIAASTLHQLINMFRFVLATLLASAYAVPLFDSLFELEDAPAECHLSWNAAEAEGTYHGRLTLLAMDGILSGCIIDRTILKEAELRYVTAVDSLIKKALPGGVCKQDTYAKVIYDAFALTRAAPEAISDVELEMMTNWCGGMKPTDAQLADIATLKAALNLYGGDQLINRIKCEC